jgi:hypothetical protein
VRGCLSVQSGKVDFAIEMMSSHFAKKAATRVMLRLHR